MPYLQSATDAANQLLACLTTHVQTLPGGPPALIQMRTGAETGPLVGENVDECCAGLAWVRIAEMYPSWNSFPAPDSEAIPTGPLGYAVVLEMGLAGCMPWGLSGDGFANQQEPPSTADWAQGVALVDAQREAMRKTAFCCWDATVRRVLGPWHPLPVEGGCTGGTMQVTVLTFAPCRDCQ